MKSNESIPLADLHVQLRGSVYAPSLLRHLADSERPLWDWYEKDMRTTYGSVPPMRELVKRFREGDTSALDEFTRHFVFSDADAGNFARFSAKSTLLWIPTDRDASKELQQRFNEEVLEFAQETCTEFVHQGVEYAEFRTEPFPGLLEMFAKNKSPLTGRVAISLNRSNPWSGWEEVKSLALGPYGDVLTAIDFCNVEEGYPPKEKAAFFKEVFTFNETYPQKALAILYHVGESFTDKSLESAIRWVQEAAELGAHRLGHAIVLGIDPHVFGSHTRKELVSERKDQIKYDLLHADGLREVGVSINETDLREEYDRLQSLADNSEITIDYTVEKLDAVRRRQDYAMLCIKATKAVIEVCPTSNRRVGGITNAAYHPIHRFLAADLPVVIASDDPGLFDVTLNKEIDWVREQISLDAAFKTRLLKTAWSSRSEVLSDRIK